MRIIDLEFRRVLFRSPGPPDHPVPAPARDGRLARSEGRAHGDGDAGVGPPPHDLVDVHLGAAGLGIVEVAPREDVDGPDPGRGGEIPDRKSTRLNYSH